MRKVNYSVENIEKINLNATSEPISALNLFDVRHY